MPVTLGPHPRWLFLVAAAIVLSAAAGLPQAGSARSGRVDGMILVYIPAGPFLMGSAPSDMDAQADEMPQRRVTLSAFWIDRTEVTDLQYRRCAEAEACRPPEHSPAYDSQLTPDHPMVGVT